MKKSLILALSTSICSLAAGSFAGYYFAKKQMAENFDRDLEEAVLQAKTYYKNLYKPNFPTPADAVKELITDADPEEMTRIQQGPGVMRIYKGGSIVTEKTLHGKEAEEAAKKIVENVFDRHVAHPEPSDRTRPYMISEDVYMANDTGASQETVTWYRGDDVVSDATDEVLEDPITYLGVDFKTFFTETDETTAYVRNEKIDVDYEVLLSTGTYQHEVAGF